jgi:hypothetical protein
MNYRTGVWSGLGGLNAQGGWTPDPVPSPASYETCAAVDSACVARNLAKNIGHEQAVAIALYGHDGDGNGPLGYLDKAKNPYLGVTPAAPSGGRVTFTSSRGGNALQVGDTWIVSITGATPNKQVTAKVGTDVTPMGTTDAGGNFTLAGTARTADVGAWNETWAVGGVPSGGFSFTVQPAVTPEGKKVINSSGAGSGTGTGGDAAGGGTGGGTGAGSGSGSATPTKFDLSKIPVWAWVAAAAAAVFALEGQGGR